MENLQIQVDLKKMKEMNGLQVAFQKAKKHVRAVAATAVILVALTVATPSAEAANIQITNITISSEGYVTENTNTYNYSDSDISSVKDLMNRIDADYNAVYDVLANGGMSLENTSYDASRARLLAFINQVNTKYTPSINGLGSSAQTVVNKYLTSKENEAKVLYASVTNISTKEVNDYAKNKQCIFGADLNGNVVNTSVFVFEKVNGNLQQTGNYNYNVNTTGFKLMKLPSVVISNSGSTSFKTNLVYKGVVVPTNSYDTYNYMINTEMAPLYDKIEVALNKGNYTKKTNLTAEQVKMTIYGDTNLVKNSLDTKYANDANAKILIEAYANYRQYDLLAKVAKKNSLTFDSIVPNYSNPYAGNPYANTVRQYENGGLVIYNLGNNSTDTTAAITDQGYLTTAGLTVNGQAPIIPGNPVNPGNPSNPNQDFMINENVNIFFNDVLFFPTDVNGKAVLPFIYNNTTYLPIRSICNIYGAEIAGYTQNTVSITRNNVSSYTYEMFGYNYTGYNTNLNYGSGTYKSQPDSKKVSGTSNITIFYNGAQQYLTDANGNPVPVIQVGGTTYLPARAISKMFGNLPITYEGNNIYIGNHYKSYDQGTNQQPGTPTNPTTPSNPSYITEEGVDLSTCKILVSREKATGNEVNVYLVGEGLDTKFYIIENNKPKRLSTDEYWARFEDIKTILPEGRSR